MFLMMLAGLRVHHPQHLRPAGLEETPHQDGR